MQPDIQAYHQALSVSDAAICDQLYQWIQAGIPDAEHKIWHAHPVWFIDGNPIVGYSKLKDGVRLLFWSGQSFNEALLKPEGKFKAAEIRFTSVNEISKTDLMRWLQLAVAIQWDYKNIVKRKGVLERLC
ncbi:MAG TPA: DUF1801 domain-containing protein [Ferruginibacter sp.]|nr:DUF1801 domain-containing protein [Ferruginibacter sp.]